MKKLVKTLFFLSAILMLISTVYAGSSNTAGVIQEKGKTVINAIVWLGYAISLGMIVFIGIKYMLGAAETKANMKSSITNWIIGAIIVFIPTTIVATVAGTTGGETGKTSMDQIIDSTLPNRPTGRNANSGETSSPSDEGRNNDTDEAEKSKGGNSNVEVQPEDVAVEGIRLSKTSVEVEKGDSTDLEISINPADAYNREVTWESSDTSIAQVQGGTVTALEEGTATITVRTVDGNKTASCEVTVITTSITDDEYLDEDVDEDVGQYDPVKDPELK